jgi:hypothetical protein
VGFKLSQQQSHQLKLAHLNVTILMLSIIYYFCHKSLKMETTKKSTGLYWILFFLSLIAFVVVYKVGGGYCSMVLPFILTFFVKAMDLL